MRLYLLLFLAYLAYCQDAFVTKRVFLKTPASFINMTSDHWEITEDIHKILVAVRFKAKSSVGQILALDAVQKDGKSKMKLVLGLLDGHLQVDLYNAKGNKILTKPMTSNFMNHSAEHSVAVRINTQENVLSYSIETRSENFAEINEQIEWTGTTLVATLGGGERSLIGCVSLMVVQLGEGSLMSKLHSINQYEVEKCSTEDECNSRNCGEGECLSLEVATCDCYGTGKTGPNCASEGRTVELNNLRDDEMGESYFQFKPWGDDSNVHRISMRFKFKDDEHRDGVLVYGSILGDGQLKMLVVNEHGTLHVGNEPKISFSLAANREFHHVELSFVKEDSELVLTVDGEKQKVVLRDFPTFSLINFGHAPSEGEAQEVGITACMKEVYVNHYDVIDMIYNKDMRVSTSTTLSQCSSNDDEIIMQGSQLFPADTIPQILPVDAMKSNLYADENDILSSDHREQNEPEDKSFGQASMFPAPSKKKEPMPVACEKNQEYHCRNGATCVRDATALRCICQPGFGGRFCQFVILPRTCAEAKSFYQLPNGPNRLDADGTGDLSLSVAECTDGITTVPHDMPPVTAIRDSSQSTNALFIVSYRDFAPQKLANLIATSAECTQQVQYSCNHAPLNFQDARTWFRVATGNKTVKQMGKLKDSCSCVDSGCLHGGKCNCDAGSITQDGGVLMNENSGVTSIVSLYNDGDVEGKMTLGSLECRGFAGESKPLRFRTAKSVPVQDFRTESLSLQFRTADQNGIIFTMDTEKVLTVELVDGHTIRLNHSSLSLTVDSQELISDTKWHLLVIDWLNEQVRLSIDSYTSYGDFKTPISGEFRLNHAERGIVGCYRSLNLNGKLVDLHKIAPSGLGRSCEDKCTVNTCMNAAECLEDFANEATVCRCKYPNIQSGANCEIDINVNSSVSFHGGYLKYEKTENPLIKQTVLSFRTDQAHALLFYAHDQNNNFIQLHLRDEINLTLSFNNEDVIHSCTVRARHGKEFGDMKWIQVSIDHLDSGSHLTVEDDACTIREPRKLATSPVKEFTHWNDDLVTIPVGLEDTANPTPFLYTFVGGVERHREIRDGSKKLRPEYLSDLPDLLGCMRGLRIGGETVDLRYTTHGYRPEDPDLVRHGCSVGCGMLSCQNGGHCAVAWKNYDPSVSKTTCDCSRTSYGGPSCTVDDGITLTAGQTFSFNFEPVLARYVTLPKKVQTFKFSFSTKNQDRQILATVYFKQAESRLQAILNKNGSVNIALTDEYGETMVHTFKGNFSDNYRHFLVFQLGEESATAVMLDATRFDFPYLDNNLDLTNAVLLIMGGQKEPLNNFQIGSAPAKKNYQGCVSNVHLDLGINDQLDFRPLSYLGNSAHSLAQWAQLVPTEPVTKTSCAPFKIPNQLPSIQNTVNLPEWETNFQRQSYNVPLNFDQTGEKSNWLFWLIFALIIIAILVVVCLLVYCCCLKRKKDKPEAAATSQKRNGASAPHEEEMRPLNPPPLVQSPTGGAASSNFNLPQPDQDLPENGGRSSWQSGGTSYFTAPEELPSDDDTEKTLTPGEDRDSERNEMFTRPSAFDFSVPHRMSSFRHPSAPRESPLYMEDRLATPRRPVPVKSPQPPAPPQRTSSTQGV